MQRGKQSLGTGNLLTEECPKLLGFFLNNERLESGGSDVLRQIIAISQKLAANKRRG